MSSAEEREGATAIVRMSAGRKPGAVSRSPSTSRSAVVSAIRVTANSSSRILLWPRVPSPGAQQRACEPLTSRVRLQSLQRMGWQVKVAPKRNLVAAIKLSESSVSCERGSTVQSHLDETVSSRKSCSRAKSASLLGCASKCASRSPSPSWSKRTERSC